MALVLRWSRRIYVVAIMTWGVCTYNLAQAETTTHSELPDPLPAAFSNPQAPESVHILPNESIEASPQKPSSSDSDGQFRGDTLDLDFDSPDADRRGWFAQLINKSEIDVAAYNSIRVDELQWSIAGNSSGSDPDIRSELSWSNVHSQQFTVAGRALLIRSVYLRGELSYAWVQDGTIQDSDYNSDDRQDEYSRSISQASGDQLWDFSLAGGYPFFLYNNRLIVAPLLGFSYHVQNFRIENGTQVKTWPEGPPLGELDGLDSTYRTRWMGPWLGCDLRYQFQGPHIDDPPMELGLSLELHWADYDAEANWNLRGDLDHPKSFEHDAKGMGCAISCEWLIQLAAQWDLAVRFLYQHWLTEYGTDRIFHSSGGTSTQRLNEVEWYTHSFMLGATYHF